MNIEYSYELPIYNLNKDLAHGPAIFNNQTHKTNLTRNNFDKLQPWFQCAVDRIVNLYTYDIERNQNPKDFEFLPDINVLPKDIKHDTKLTVLKALKDTINNKDIRLLTLAGEENNNKITLRFFYEWQNGNQNLQFLIANEILESAFMHFKDITNNFDSADDLKYTQIFFFPIFQTTLVGNKIVRSKLFEGLSCTNYHGVATGDDLSNIIVLLPQDNRHIERIPGIETLKHELTHLLLVSKTESILINEGVAGLMQNTNLESKKIHKMVNKNIVSEEKIVFLYEASTSIHGQIQNTSQETHIVPKSFMRYIYDTYGVRAVDEIVTLSNQGIGIDKCIFQACNISLSKVVEDWKKLLN